MKLTSFETIESHLLFGLLNTALRNDFDDLEDLSKFHDLDQERLLQKLREAGYHYMADLNQFRPTSSR
jgi:hypothetical protein